ncbi:MAG: hypothetical protein IRY91_04655 [Gemmatimonadaceae bacterium]|nr:hypothetical protein [Gemmatimonadaceae bacterium]
MLAIPLLAGTLAGCSPDNLLGTQQLPPDVPDPAQTHTPAGALAAYRGALQQFRTSFGGADAMGGNSFVPVTGLFTDELRWGELGQIGATSDPMLVDSRFLLEDPGTGDDQTAGPVRAVYGALQKARGQASEARGALRAYLPDSSAALVGHLDAVQAYEEIFLADFFCSGIPLSTLDFGGDFTYAPGSTTAEVYEHAVALFDSALALSADSVAILNLARVGKARALLALGRYAEAAAAVADVPDDFRYTVFYSATTSPGAINNFLNKSFAYTDFGGTSLGFPLTMVDTEGVNGLPFLSNHDPRVAWTSNGTNRYGLAQTRPTMYPKDGSGTITLASGVEARLIEAEAQLNGAMAGDWLTTLNALRTNGTFTRVDTTVDHVDTTDVGGTPQVDTTYRYDTLWVAGTGGVAHLGPLTDPGTQEARVDLLFRERAFWLFLTGHRQGDLRRLVREYGRQQQDVYPAGTYPGAYNTYGTDVTAPIPGDERVSNPLFTGCRSRGA